MISSMSSHRRALSDMLDAGGSEIFCDPGESRDVLFPEPVFPSTSTIVFAGCSRCYFAFTRNIEQELKHSSEHGLPSSTRISCIVAFALFEL